MTFRCLHARLIGHLRERVRSGELTERRIARVTGISQPHIHHVLKGTRLLSDDMADQVLANLHITVWDLFDTAEVRTRARDVDAWPDIPLLDGNLGPGSPFPSALSRQRLPVSPELRQRLRDAVGARLASDGSVSHLFRGGDYAVLERSEACRIDVDPNVWYAVRLGDSAAVRRLRADDNGSDADGSIAVTGNGAGLVVARVVALFRQNL